MEKITVAKCIRSSLFRREEVQQTRVILSDDQHHCSDVGLLCKGIMSVGVDWELRINISRLIWTRKLSCVQVFILYFHPCPHSGTWCEQVTDKPELALAKCIDVTSNTFAVSKAVCRRKQMKGKVSVYFPLIATCLWITLFTLWELAIYLHGFKES